MTALIISQALISASITENDLSISSGIWEGLDEIHPLRFIFLGKTNVTLSVFAQNEKEYFNWEKSEIKWY